LTNVPVLPLPLESATAFPSPSLNGQLALKPAGDAFVLPLLVMISESTVEVLPLYVPFPPYTAVMAWGEPLTASALVLKLAMPEAFNALLPRLLIPS
jgi:hypothetical protein